MLYVILFFIAIAFYERQKILAFTKQFDSLKNMGIEVINIILVVSFSIILAIATINPEKSKDKFKDISENFENMRSPSKNDRPNPLFDINTYF